MSYEKKIQEFLFSELPNVSQGHEARFEAISAAIFGTKQRRNGPMPSPEQQVEIRKRLQRGLPMVNLFIPWGCSKQQDNAPLDLLEFMALKQLKCLCNELTSYGCVVKMTIRLEDLTDVYLLGTQRQSQVSQYKEDFQSLSFLMSPSIYTVSESAMMSRSDFFSLADSFIEPFRQHIKGRGANLVELGWTGVLGQTQIDHYIGVYRRHYPYRSDEEIITCVAKYFSAALARHRLQGTGMPPGDSIIPISFVLPVPGVPGVKLYYRTLPCRYTHLHYAPWLAQGKVILGGDDGCVVKYLDDASYPHYDATIGYVKVRCYYEEGE